MKKKVLKVIQVIYDILSLGFIVFVIVAMAVTPKSEGHHDNNSSEVVEKKTHYNAYVDNNYNYMGVSEFGYFTYYQNFIDNLKNYEYVFNTGVSVSNFLLGQNLYIDTTSFDIDLGNINSESGVFTKGADILGVTLRIDATSDISEEFVVGFNVGWGTEWVYSQYIYFDNSKDLCVSNNIKQFNTNPETNLDGATIKYSLSDLGSLLPRFDAYDNDQAYANGYAEGKREGYNTAVTQILNPDSNQYQYIYDLGKQEGLVEGMRGTESNAFVVIGQAFASVGSVLSIEVMPNLPLWVLVFTPLIVAVVIVVVKLIKG